MKGEREKEGFWAGGRGFQRTKEKKGQRGLQGGNLRFTPGVMANHAFASEEKKGEREGEKES